ncbi:MAG: T9SS type A sorting domain-containing protein [Crocinitomicaceae bacterium]|nr:T9SS type A sorting domain-containing protein [Crocinitomicaceae bacterium]
MLFLERNKIFSSLFILIACLVCQPVSACDSTLIIAHRGASGIAPQNTLAAFQLAIDIGADYLELDVRKSSDDSLMVIHDATVNATTNGSGFVNSKTYTELRALDAGSWFSSAYIGEQIPTLFEVLLLAKINGSKVCVEMKDSGIESEVISMIQSLNMVNEIIVFSFVLSELQTIKVLEPSIKICFLDASISQTEITDLVAIGGEYVGCGNIPTLDDVEFARNLNVGYFAWTVNDPVDMQKLMSKGFDGIITDDPQECVGLKTFMGIGNGGLVAYWDMDEGSGLVLNDSSGNSNTASLSNTTWTTGYTGEGLGFNGVSSFASIPISASLDLVGDAVSLSVWLKLAQLPSSIGGTFGPIFDSDQDSYILFLDQANAELRFKVTDNDGDAERPGIPETLLNTTSWFHVVGVYNGDEAMIYLNGELVDYHVNTSLDNLEPGQIPSLGENGGFFFDGAIDEFKIYDRALSRDEVELLYQGQSIVCNTTLNDTLSMASIGFTDIQDTLFCDSAYLSYSVSELPRISFEFDGIVDYVNVNCVISDISGMSHAFFGWFRSTNATSDERIFSINGNPSSNDNVCLFGMYNGLIDVYNGAYYSGSTLINDGNWHFLGYTWDIATQQLQLWVDGVLDGNYNTNLLVSSTDLGSLGQEFDGLTVSNQYQGDMAEITIWNTVLTGPQISQLMHNPVSSLHPNYSNLVADYHVASSCASELKDCSSFENHGTSCNSILHAYEVIPSFNSTDFSLSWSSSILGVISTSDSVSFLASSTQSILFNADNGYGTVFIDSITVVKDNCVELDESSSSHYTVYPNPCTQDIHIKSSTQKLLQIEVYSTQGKHLFTQYCKGDKESQINVSEYNRGTYWLRLVTESKTSVVKVLKY